MCLVKFLVCWVIACVFSECRNWFDQIREFDKRIACLGMIETVLNDSRLWKMVWFQTRTLCQIKEHFFFQVQFVVKLYLCTIGKYMITKVCKEKHCIDSSWLKIFLQFLNFSRLLRSPSKAKSVHELSATIYDSLPQSLKEPVAVRSKIEDPELQQQRFELTRLVFEALSILTVFAGNSKEGCNWRHGLSAAIKIGTPEPNFLQSGFKLTCSH